MIFTFVRYFALVAAIGISLILAVISVLRRRRNPVNLSFAIWSLIIAGYVTVVLTAVNSNDDLARAKFWIQAALLAVVLVAGAASFFSLTFRHNAFRRNWLIRYALILGACLIGTLFLLPRFLGGVTQGNWNPIAHPAEPWYLFSWIPVTVLSIQALVNLLCAARGATGLRRAQLQYVFLGIALFWGVGSVTGFILPLFGFTGAQGVSAAFTIALTIPIAYAMVVHRLFDMSILARRILSGLVTLALTAGGFVGVVFILSRFTQEPSTLFSPRIISLTILLAIFSVAGSGWMRSRIQRVIYNLERLAPGNRYLLAEQLAVFLRNVTGIEHLLDHVLEKVTSGLEISHSEVYLPDPSGRFERAAAYGNYPEDPQESTDRIVQILRKRRDIVLRLELADSHLEQDREILEEFTSAQVEMAIPIMSRDDLIGFWTVGPKFSEDIYTAQDIGFFRAVASQMAVGVTNSRLYTAVEEEKVYQRTILDNLPSGVISLDLEGRITAANRGAVAILGREMDELRGLRVERVSPVFHQVSRQTSFDGRPELRMEVSIEVPGSPTPVPLSMSSLVLRNAEAEPIGCLLIFTDQSRIKQMEREVRRSESLAALGRFAASIAHEIRNPLVSIKTFTRLLPDRYEDEEFRTSFAELAAEEIDRISGLLDHLLDLVRPSMVKQETVDLRSLLDGTLQAVKAEYADSGIETVRGNWETPCLVRGDGEKLKQVFINLVQNAAQAMGTGGSLTVAFRRLEGIPAPESGDAMLHVSPTGTVAVDVEDTGTGIPAEILDTIFEPFFTTRDKGTGLGLSICHKIITDHGGKIFVSSTLGEGTTFTVCLPLHVGMAEEPAPMAAAGQLRKSLL